VISHQLHYNPVTKSCPGPTSTVASHLCIMLFVQEVAVHMHASKRLPSPLPQYLPCGIDMPLLEYPDASFVGELDNIQSENLL
jgi:hypothetical protein